MNKEKTGTKQGNEKAKLKEESCRGRKKKREIKRWERKMRTGETEHS